MVNAGAVGGRVPVVGIAASTRAEQQAGCERSQDSNCSRYPGFFTAISPYTFRHVSVQLRIQSQ